jgi:hypothetical protein
VSGNQPCTPVPARAKTERGVASRRVFERPMCRERVRR